MKFSLSLVLLYLAIVSLLTLASSFALRLSHLIFLLLPIAFLEKNIKKFLLQWAPFWLVIFLYDAFRSIADDLNPRVNFLLLPELDRIFSAGSLPTVWLQEHLGSSLYGVLGVILSIFYFGHFILPVTVLYILSRTRPKAFRVTISSIALVSIFGFITFALFPAAPPWMASSNSIIPNTERLILFHLESISSTLSLPQLYLSMSPNHVAPFPSLHASYPWLLFLASRRYFPRFSWIFLANLLIVSFTLVAFAEHYVVDIAAGIVYAYLSLRLVEKVALRFYT